MSGLRTSSIEGPGSAASECFEPTVCAYSPESKQCEEQRTD